MTRDMRLYLQDILDSIAKIAEYTKDINEQEFLANTQTQDAVLRRLEIIGEAVKNIPIDFRDSYPHIPWKAVAGLRDVLIHEYFGVNIRRAWKMIKHDIFDLRKQLQQVQSDLGSTD